MKSKIVCLCGSTKFKKEFEQIMMEESLKGNIVLSVGCFAHYDEIRLSKDEKKDLDELHRNKIDMADEIIIINVKGYIGESTRNEIKYAKETGKPIRYLVDPEWYGDGTEEELGEVDIGNEELQDFFKAIYKVFDKEKLKSDVIESLRTSIKKSNERSVNIIDMLLKKLTSLSEREQEEFKKTMLTDEYTKNDYVKNRSTWTSYFNTNEVREISDYINDATSLLSKDCLWSIEDKC